MIKIFLAFLVLAGIASATEVAICQFKTEYSGFAEDKMTCPGSFEKVTTIKDMYADGWKFKGSYRTNMYEAGGQYRGTKVIKEYTYIVMEKEDK
ncbi:MULTISPECIES: hypothetical protein [Campylobacterales]|uniref:hypothetical protein n=1 Tax=Campylobacterales TaxID=213849 RepID=UPI003D0397EE